MIVMNNNQRLYLTSWEYNAARILSRLAHVVTNEGGSVKPLKNAVISNRTIPGAIKEYRERIERYTELNKELYDASRDSAIRDYLGKLVKLKAINNDPITVTHTTYIEFTLNGFYYYYQLSYNPFFDFSFRKTPIADGKYARWTNIEEDKKEWLFDCFFRAGCSDEDTKEAAQLIFNMLTNAQICRPYNSEMKKIDF